jgi:hypothetical protein
VVGLFEENGTGVPPVKITRKMRMPPQTHQLFVMVKTDVKPL